MDGPAEALLSGALSKAGVLKATSTTRFMPLTHSPKAAEQVTVPLWPRFPHPYNELVEPDHPKPPLLVPTEAQRGLVGPARLAQLA